MLGSIFALCLLTLATAFVLITIRLFGKYFQITLNYKTEPSEISGFPYPVTLMILHSGHIIEFSTISKKKNEKNGLPGLDKLPKNNNYNEEYPWLSWSTNTFAFESQGYIFFLSTNNQQNVIKYNIYGRNHREISESKIKNHHFDLGNSGNFKTHGVQIGEFYWIILGPNICLTTVCAPL